MKTVVLTAMLLIATVASAEDHEAGQFSFGFRDGMTFNEFLGVARTHGVEPVRETEDQRSRTLTVEPPMLSLNGVRVERYRTMFVHDRLWGLTVELQGTKDLGAHRKLLRNLISYMDRSFPGETTSDRYEEFCANPRMKGMYVYEMRYKGVLFTVISNRGNDGTYAAWVTFSDMNPGRLKYR